jgi:hypothetical protein
MRLILGITARLGTNKFKILDLHKTGSIDFPIWFVDHCDSNKMYYVSNFLLSFTFSALNQNRVLPAMISLADGCSRTASLSFFGTIATAKLTLNTDAFR